MATQDVLDFISKQRAAGKGVKIDFSSLPSDVDTRQVVGALTDGLPQEHANAINALALGGKGAAVDYGKIPQAQPPQGPPPGQGGIYQDYPWRRRASQLLIRPALEMAGQGIGGLAGGAAAGAINPALAVPGAIAAGGAGGTGADVLADKIDEAMGLYHPETMSPDATRRMRLTQLATNTAGAGLGMAASGFAKNVAAPYVGEIDQAVKGASERLGIPVTAGGMLKSETPGRMEALFNKLPFMSDVMRKYYQSARDKMVNTLGGLFEGGQPPSPQAVNKLGTQVAQDLGQKIDDLARSKVVPQLDPGDVGMAVRQDVLGGLKGMAKQAGQAFEDIKALDTGERIATPNVAKQIESLSGEGIKTPAITKVSSVLSGASPTSEMSPQENAAIQQALQSPSIPAAQKQELMKQVAGEQSGATLSQLIDARNSLSQAAHAHVVEGGRGMAADRLGGAYNSLISALDKDIEAASPGIAGKYAKARANWGVYAQQRDNSAIRRILNAEQPEAIVDDLVKPDRTTNLGRAMTMMSPDTREQFQNAFINKAIDAGYDADGKFVPAKMNSFLARMGDETVNLAAGPDGAKNLKQLANLSDGSFSDPSFRNFVTLLGKRDGANVSGLMLQPNNAANINRIRALIGEKSFSDAHDAALFDLATNNQGNLDFAGLGKRLNDVGDDTLHSLFGPETTATLKDLADVGRGLGRAEKVFSNPSGTAQVFGLMAIMFRALNNPLNALKFIGTLTGTAKAYTSPFVTKWLTEGIAPNAAGDVASLGVKLPLSVIGNSLANPYKKAGKK